MRTLRSESLLIFPLFPIFLAGAFPFLLMGFLGFAGLGVLGLLMICVALMVGLDADTEFKMQSTVADRTDSAMQTSTRDAMVRVSKAVGSAGAGLVVISVAGLSAAG